MPGTEQEWNELNNSRYTERRLPRFWTDESDNVKPVQGGVWKAAEESLDTICDAINALQDEVTRQRDEVNHPDHYNTGKVECIEAIKASMSAEEFKGYLKGNTLKYLWRYNYKGKPKQDLEKAQWYLNKLIGEV